MVTAVDKRSKLTADQWREVEILDGQGVPRAEIARRLRDQHGVEITRARLSQVLGAKEFRPAEESVTMRVELTREEIERIRAVAKARRLVVINGVKAGEGSISGLLRAIARGEVEVSEWRSLERSTQNPSPRRSVTPDEIELERIKAVQAEERAKREREQAEERARREREQEEEKARRAREAIELINTQAKLREEQVRLAREREQAMAEAKAEQDRQAWDRLMEVVRLRDQEGKTLREISDILGISRSRAHQLYVKGLMGVYGVDYHEARRLSSDEERAKRAVKISS